MSSSTRISSASCFSLRLFLFRVQRNLDQPLYIKLGNKNNLRSIIFSLWTCPAGSGKAIELKVNRDAIEKNSITQPSSFWYQCLTDKIPLNNIEHAQKLIRNEILWISVHLILWFAEKFGLKLIISFSKSWFFFVAFFITILTIMSLKDLSNIKGQLTPVQLLHYKYSNVYRESKLKLPMKTDRWKWRISCWLSA